MSENEKNIAEEYFYVKSDADHYDLADEFGGVYLKSEKLWRFKKNQEQEVTEFLRCSSSESDEAYNDAEIKDGDPTLQAAREAGTKAAREAGTTKKKLRNRLHRANSFNASDESNSSCDSFDDSYRRHRKPKASITKERNRINALKEKNEK